MRNLRSIMSLYEKAVMVWRRELLLELLKLCDSNAAGDKSAKIDR